VYFQTARQPVPSRSKRQPPPNREKNHGPRTIVIPTDVGGRYDAYSLTMLGSSRAKVLVRTPGPGAVAPSRKNWRRMNGSHRNRTWPVVCETAKASSGGTGT